MIKKIFALVLTLVCVTISFSQGYPLQQNLGSDSTIVISKGALQSRLIPIVITDTNSANAQRLKNYPGAQLYTTNGDFYIRNSTATKWVLLSSGSSGSVNIYTADGTLTGNRTLTGANNNLTFDGLNKFTVTTGDTTLFNTNTFGIKGVGGVLNVEGTAAGTTSSLTLKTASDGNWTISTGVAGLELGDLRFYDNDNGGGSARMIIKSTGKVGIGTETPDSMLSVAQGAYFGRGIIAPNLPSALGTKALRIDAQGKISVADTTLGGGTVIQVNTNDGSGITGGPITVSGTLAIDTTNVIATKLSVAGGLAGKLNISDTANMLKNYVNQVGYALTKVNQVVSADSATLSNYYLRRKDSLTATNSLGYVTKTVLADTAAAIRSSDAGGTVTSVATNNGTGITGGTITTSGTLAIDTTVISTRAWRQKGVDSLQANINLKLNISDTASMLSPYLRKADTTAMLANYVNNVGYALSKVGQVVSVDSSTLSNYYLRRKDSLTATNLLGYVTRTILADTAAAIRGADAGGTVTSVATNNGTGITGGTITTSGTLAIDTTVISTRAWRQKGVDSVVALVNTKVGGSGIANYFTKWSGSGTIDTSQLYQNGESIGLGTTSPNARLAIVDTGGFALKINYNSSSSASDSNAAIYAENNGLSSYAAIFNEKTTNNTGGQIPVLFESSLTTGTAQANMGTGADFGLPDNLNTRKLNRMIFRTIDPAAGTYTSRLEMRLWNSGSQTTPYYWLGNGNMGLGTATPDSNLTVVNGAYFQRGIRASGLPQAAGTKALRIDASGTISYADTLIDAGGTVTSVATNTGTGITGGTITTSGTLAIDTLLISTRAWRQKGIDSVAALINSNVSGTTNYVPKFTGTNTLGNSIIIENVSPPAIGIGTTAPSFTLDVNGSGRFVNALTAASFNGSVSNIFTVGGSEVMRLTNTSATNLGLGIGTTSPDSMLTVTQGAYLQRGVRLSGLPSGIGTKELRIDANGVVYANDTLSNDISGSGTTNYIPKFTGTSAIGNSVMYDDGTNIGIGTTTPLAKLQVASSIRSQTVFGGTFTAHDGTDNVLFGSYLNTIGTGNSYDGVISLSNASASLMFNTGGSERMRLTSTGLGIGTSNPARKLHVYSGSGTAQIQSSGTSSMMYFGDANSSSIDNQGIGSIGNNIWVMTGGSERLRIDASGNLGLGVTPSAWNAGGKAIEIGMIGSAHWGLDQTSTYRTTNAYWNSGWKYGGTGQAANYAQEAGSHYWSTAPSGTAGNAISFTQAMTLDASGRLGIGTTSPTKTLSLYDASSSRINFITSTTGTNTNDGTEIGIFQTSNNAFIWNYENTDFYIGTNNTERMRITSGGNVLVGTTTDNGNKFQVSGTANATQFNSTSGTVSVAPSTNTTFFTPSGAGLYMAHVYLDGNATQTWDATIIFAYNATNILVVNQTNSVNVSTQISGTDIQVRQIGGTTYTFNYEVIRIK